MAGELKFEMRSEAVVDPILGQVFSQIDAQVGQTEMLALRIGDALRQATESALPLATAFKTANETAAESAQKWQASLDDIGRKLATQLDTLPKLTKAYEDLGKAMGAVRLPAAVQPSEREAAREKVVDASGAVLKSAGGSVDTFASYEGIVGKLVRQGEKDPKKWAAQTERVEAQIARMTHGTSLSKTEAANQLLSMFNAGMDLNDLVPEGRLAARFADGQQVSEGVTAGLFRTLSQGQGTAELERLLNTIIGQAGDGKLGITSTAEAITRLLPQVGGAPEDVVRLSAILQQESKKTGNYNDVVSATKALFLEYKREGGSSAADLARYGQAFMPKQADGPVPNYIEEKLDGRQQSLEWQQKARESANERVSVGVGGALAPIYSTWTNLMTTAANILGVVVEQLSGVVTVLGGVVVGVAGVVTALAAVAKGKVLLEAAKLASGPQGKVLADAARTVFKPQANDPGVRGRVVQAAGKVKTLLPESLRSPSTIPAWQKVAGGSLAAIASLSLAVDTYQNAGSAKEKSEGYGEAAGTLVGGLLGAFLGPLGSAAVGYVGGKLGKLAGAKINEIWGEDGKEGTVNTAPPLPGLPGADAGKLLTVVKAPGPGDLLLKAPGETGRSLNSDPGVSAPKMQSVPVKADPGTGEVGTVIKKSSPAILLLKEPGETGGRGLRSGQDAPALHMQPVPALPGMGAAGAVMPRADAGKLLTVIKEPGPGALLLNAPGETGGRSNSGPAATAPKMQSVPLNADLGTGQVGAVVKESSPAILLLKEPGETGGRGLRPGQDAPALHMQPVPGLPGVGGVAAGAVIKEIRPGALLRKEPGNADDVVSHSSTGVPAVLVAMPGAALESPPGGQVQYGREHTLQSQRPVPVRSGDVVRSLADGAPAAISLPESNSATPVSINAASPQHFAVSPTIAINVQGTITEPAELVRILQPEVQRMFTDLAAQTNRGNQMWDNPAATYVA
ncbi:hypothetical protein [Pseudomonas japonica]|uniref:Phage-related minor tail protein n=1 Tax=Pseudomonas japonica TaxID=256466 RepID=A0A239FE95_9PSED|nr:hypothetical protein [Pseudomonas japonica]SNS55239.1 hypothetical protein SAMN05444352_11032 [Pseudomonas japonica]